MTKAYVRIGVELSERGYLDVAAEVYELSLLIGENSGALNGLAKLAHNRQEFARAITFAERSLAVAPSQPRLHAFAAQIAARILGDPARARAHLQHAIELDPSLEPALRDLVQESTR